MRISPRLIFVLLTAESVLCGCSSSDSGASADGGGIGGSGSGSGPSGSGGGDKLPVHVTPCPAGSGAVGKWQEITPPQFLEIPGATWELPADGSDRNLPLPGPADVSTKDGSVFLSGFTWNGGSTGLLKSTDCGANWKKVSTGKNSDVIQTGALWSIHVAFDDPDVIYVANGYGGLSLYQSTNGGVDWEDMFPAGSEVNTMTEQPSFVQGMGMDPTDSKHLVVTFHTNCKGAFAPTCLAETTDAGKTWRLLKGPPDAKSWSEASSITVLGKTSWIYASPDLNGVFYTGDSGKTWQHVLEGAAYGNYTGSTYLAADGAIYLGVANLGVFASRPGAGKPLGTSWTLLPGSPQASTLVGDGERLFSSYAWDTSGQPFYAASLDNPTTWEHLETPTIKSGAEHLAYDALRHVLYAPSGNRVYRVVTR